ncbi:hypothetical protein ABZP36_033554 [Zizania latifolia]
MAKSSAEGAELWHACAAAEHHRCRGRHRPVFTHVARLLLDASHPLPSSDRRRAGRRRRMAKSSAEDAELRHACAVATPDLFPPRSAAPGLVPPSRHARPRSDAALGHAKQFQYRSTGGG